MEFHDSLIDLIFKIFTTSSATVLNEACNFPPSILMEAHPHSQEQLQELKWFYQDIFYRWIINYAIVKSPGLYFSLQKKIMPKLHCYLKNINYNHLMLNLSITIGNDDLNVN